MPLVIDPIVLDPADFVPYGAELDLSGAGFRVLDANFGEADVDLEMQRQAIGEVPTTYHPSNTTTVLALGVRAEGEVDLPTAAHQLAAKIGEINTPGTEHWVRRDFEVGGDFAGSLAKRVYKATLSGLGAWQRGESPDVVLTLVTGPYWYATVEQESAVFESEVGARELILELAEVLGTSPGLIRIRITNEGEEDWRALILAGEARDMAQDNTADTTAAMAYDAADLTPLGEAKEAERESVKVVRHENIPNIWLSILDSEIKGVGHWTHKGVRRVWVRIWDPGSEAGLVQLRLEWRAQGTVQWSKNSMVSTPLIGGWALMDLGECRPEPAALGDERWECRIAVRTTGTAGADLDIQRIYPLPTEQWALARQPIEIEVPTDLLVHDFFNQSEGNATGKTAESGGGYAAVTNSDASDFTIAGGKLKRTTVSDAGTIGTWPFKGRAIGTATKFTALAMLTDWATEGSSGVTFGHVLSYVDNTHFVMVAVLPATKGVYVYDPAGTLLASKTGVPGIALSGTEIGKYRSSGMLLSVVQGRTLVVYVGQVGGSFAKVLSVQNILIGVEGKAAIYDQNISATASTREYDNLAVWEPELPALCSAGRSIELRTDGIFRQHPEDDVWGELTPEGFLPYASPSGLEGRKSRFIVIPSQGDLGEVADSGSNPFSIRTFVRPAYHVAREAA